MRRSIPLVLAALLLVASAAPATAAKPSRGCPNPSFQAMTLDELRSMFRDIGVAEDWLGDKLDAAWAKYNKNGDAYLCVKDLPDTKGHLGNWVWNVVDNTANH